MIAWWLALALGGTPLDAARADAELWPEDYAAAVAWARAAALEGRWDEALTAWDRAAELSGGNLEAGLGQVEALREVGRGGDAARAARALSEAHPEVAAAWEARAASARGPQGAVDLRAEPWLREALERDPTEARACALAAVRLRLGGAGAGCPELLGGRPWSVWGAAFVAGMGRTGDALIDGGAAGVAQVGADWRGRLWADLTVRSLGWHTLSGAGWTEQHEGWLRLGGGARGAGFTAVVGGLWPGGASTYDAPTGVFGGRAWATAWATLSLEGAYSVHADGTGWQVGGDVVFPVTPRLSVGGGLLHTALEAGGVTASWSGRARLTWTDRWGSVDLVGRFGQENRAVRLDEPSAWNFTRPMGPSGDLRIGWQVSPWLRVTAGYGLGLLLGEDQDPSTVQVGTVGLVIWNSERR